MVGYSFLPCARTPLYTLFSPTTPPITVVYGWFFSIFIVISIAESPVCLATPAFFVPLMHFYAFAL